MSEATAVIKIAQAEIGYKEGWNGTDWDNIQKYSEELPGYQWSDGQPWCDVFFAWCFWKAGLLDRIGQTESASVGYSKNEWKAENRYSDYPCLGGQAIFGRNGDAHTGLVVGFDSVYVYTIEGNTNADGSAEGYEVLFKQHRRTDAWVYGYGMPTYADGIISADPAHGGVVSAGITAQNQNPDGGPALTPVPQQPAPTPTPQPQPAAAAVVSLQNCVDAAQHDPSAPQGAATHSDDVSIVQNALIAEGLLDGNDQSWGRGCWGTITLHAYAGWQQREGFSGADADGVPGATTLKALGARHNFSVNTAGASAPIAPPAPSPAPPAPTTVSLSALVAAAHADLMAPQGVSSHRADVVPVQNALEAEGLLNASDPSWGRGCFGSVTIRAYANWQRRLGYGGSDADGIPGMTSLRALAAKHGFGVTS